MTVAEKLVAIAENESKVYKAGKRAEWDAFWETFQNGGEPANYRYAFIYDRFTDATFNPKYPIICNTDSSASQYMFYYCNLTSTKVEIVLGSDASYCFNKASELKTIPLLTVNESTKFGSSSSIAFGGCTSLENLTVGGTIGQSINLGVCPLTRASIESVVLHLSDDASGMTVTFKESAVLAAFGTSEAWETYIASKKNWTFTLASSN